MTRLPSAVAICVGAVSVLALPAQASFPGANGLIAYSTGPDANRGQIHTMTAAGKDRRRLATDGSSRNPAWSADGERLAFDQVPDGGGRRSLYVMDADGSSITRVPTGSRQAYNPSWSANGRRLAFQGCRGSENKCERPAIFVVGVRGKSLKRVARNGTDPVWSPNGKWIAYRGTFASGDECPTLLRVRPSGRGRQAVLPRGRDSHDTCSWGGYGADFSPDGRRLVYYGLHPTGREEYPNPVGGTIKVWRYDPAMYVVDVDGKNRKLIATRSLREVEYFIPPFVWSPDGDRLLWRDERGTFVSRADGSERRRIADGQTPGGEYNWQPRQRG
jgi:Tol biopolymer transport system component